jgi:hypothetical protein
MLKKPSIADAADHHISSARPANWDREIPWKAEPE